MSLRILLFGPLELRRDGETLPSPRTAKAGWLLALLILRGGAEVSRLGLAETLWPESLQAEALTSLRQRLADVRLALGPDASRLVGRGNRWLGLDLDGLECDVLEFDRAVREGTPALLARAVVMHRGPLCEGCHEPWAVEAREARRSAWLNALDALAAQAEQAGDLDLALTHLRRALAADPQREMTARRLMRLLGRRGEGQAAVEVYQELRRRLREDAGGTPHQETTDLFRSLAVPNRGPGALYRSSELPHRTAGTPHLPGSGLVGREADLAELSRLAADARLITLVGPGGAGKTRLAQEFSRQQAFAFADGVVLVSLAECAEPVLLGRAIAVALRLPEPERTRSAGVDPNGERTRLLAYLARRQLLLVLDNCEHLCAECASLCRALLAACPDVRIVATSRERLGVPEEQVYRVLPLPEPLAVELLRARAGALGNALPDDAATRQALGEISRRVDGLPLGLELVSGLLESFSPAEIAARLAQASPSAVPADPRRELRHRSLEAAIRWSYDLLSPRNQFLFRRLSVFADGWTLEAARELAGEAAADLLLDLVRKSLVASPARTGETRFRLLETLRDFGRARLREAEEEESAEQGRLEYLRRWAERVEPELSTNNQAGALAALDRELMNIRGALAWALREAASVSPTVRLEALRLACAVGLFWRVRGHFTEGREWLRRALAAAGAAGVVAPLLRARALGWLGYLALYQGDYAAAGAAGEEAVSLFRDLGDRAGLADALGCLAVREKDQGRSARAEALFRESLEHWRALQHPGGIASAEGYLGILAQDRGDFATARRCFAESLRLRRARGDRWGIAAVLNNLGLLALDQSAHAEAEALLAESLVLRRELGDRRATAITLNLLARAALRRGDAVRARNHARESLRLSWEVGELRGVAYGLESLAELARADGDLSRCARLCGAAEALRKELASPLPDRALEEYRRRIAPTAEELQNGNLAAAFAVGEAALLEHVVRDATGGGTEER